MFFNIYCILTLNNDLNPLLYKSFCIAVICHAFEETSLVPLYIENLQRWIVRYHLTRCERVPGDTGGKKREQTKSWVVFARRQSNWCPLLNCSLVVKCSNLWQDWQNNNVLSHEVHFVNFKTMLQVSMGPLLICSRVKGALEEEKSFIILHGGGKIGEVHCTTKCKSLLLWKEPVVDKLDFRSTLSDSLEQTCY